MPRRVQDIVPSSRRSIRDISVSREKGSHMPLERAVVGGSRLQSEKKPLKSKDEISVKIHKIEEKPHKDPMRRMEMTPPPAKKKKSKKGMWLLSLVGIIIVLTGGAFIASTYFSRAIFSITPKVVPVTIANTLVVRSGTASAPTDLTYEIISMKATDSVVVPATDGPVVSTKAEGEVTIYNAYSASSIRLIAGTRLSPDSGKVYRLKSSIVIPGFTTSKTASTVGGIVPGSISTTIVADVAGPDYNISRSDAISDFKIVAYKGSSKYDSVYARLTTDVTGGASGTKKVVSPTVSASSTATLKAEMKSSLIAQVKAAVPDGYIMYDDNYVSTFSSPVVGGTDKGSATLTIGGSVYGIIFKKANLISKLAGPKATATFGNLGFTAPGLDQLSFSISNIRDFVPEKKGTLIIAVKGEMKLIGTIPVDALKNALAGKSLAESRVVLESYSPVIEDAEGELVPPWSKIPGDTGRIQINVKE